MASRNRQGERHRGGETEKEREEEGEGEGTLPGVEKEGEEPEAVSSCHHPELRLAPEPWSLGASEPQSPGASEPQSLRAAEPQSPGPWA